MPGKASRIRIERGLYRSGNVYFACATPLGSRTVVWKKLGAVGLMEARRLRDEFAAQTHRAPAAPRSRRVTYAEVAEEWLSDQDARVAAGDLARSTLAGYRDELERYILPVFAGRQIASITPNDLVRWHRDMQRRGLSTWSIKHAWAPLRLVLRYAVRHYGLSGNPADALLPTERPKPGKDRKRFLNRKEIELLLDAAVDPYRLPIATAIFSGLRIGELLGLTWEDIDFKAGLIKVRFQATRPGERARLKTPAARRDVILMPELGSDLRRHRLASPWARPQDIVFASKVGTSPDQRNVANRGLKIACREAGLEAVSFHVLRHTFASILIAQGHDVVFVSRQLGHANAAITLKVYAHWFDGPGTRRRRGSGWMRTTGRCCGGARSRVGSSCSSCERQPATPTGGAGSIASSSSGSDSLARQNSRPTTCPVDGFRSRRPHVVFSETTVLTASLAHGSNRAYGVDGAPAVQVRLPVGVVRRVDGFRLRGGCAFGDRRLRTGRSGTRC